MLLEVMLKVLKKKKKKKNWNNFNKWIRKAEITSTPDEETINLEERNK